MSINFSFRGVFAVLALASTACTSRSARMDTAVAGGALDTIAQRMSPDTSMSSMPGMNPGTPTASTPTVPAAGIILATASRAGHGTILVDGNGRTLYTLNHAPTDTTIWRPVNGTSAPTTTDTAINGSMVGTATGANGMMQATYNGKPLYYFAGDSTPDAAAGSGKTQGGATGTVVRVSKHKM